MADMVDTYKVSFDDAIRNVTALDDIPLPDDVPSIQAVNCAINYQVDFNTNFEDRGAFRIAHARYPEEAQVQSQLHTLLEQGKQFAVMLYTWRSCSRALPPIRSNEQPYRIQIYEKTVEILEPYVTRLREFKAFQQSAIDRFCEQAQRLCHEKRREDFVSSGYLLSLGRLLCMFALLDEMKNMKASMKNDHSHYKRATQFLRNLDRDSMHESQVLSLFLAEQNVIRDKLREQLGKVAGVEELLADIVSAAMQAYDGRLYVLPEEKHTLVMMIAFGIHLIDGQGQGQGQGAVNVNKMSRRLNFPRVDRILKECEVVNLFGDMSLCPFSYVRACPNYEAARWPECSGNRLSGQGVLLDHMARFREEYTTLTAELAWHTNLATTRDSGRSSRENRDLYGLMLRALQLLSGWTVQVLDTYTWKLAHCTDSRQNPLCPADAEDYEKATRYNYSSQEQFALVEVIGMVKAVQGQLVRLDASYSEGVRNAVYLELQTFVQCTLNEPYRRAVKAKKTIVAWLIDSIRAACQDKTPADPADGGLAKSTSSSTLGSSGGAAPTKKAAVISGSEQLAATESIRQRIKPRDVGPGSTQMYLVRTTVESLIATRVTQSGGSLKNSLRKDIDPASLACLEQFHRQSFYWPYLLNLTDTVSKCCDMSQFWYREFFLEMTNGQRVQFPIEMSIPWLLTDHLLETQDPAFTEMLLYPLDLYNDSARCALTTFRSRFLYDEIEAEANLAFDQLVFKLAGQLFVHHKQYAASLLLDKRFRAEVAKAGGAHVHYPPPNRYSALMRQRQVHLLGRCVDLGRLLAQRVNRALLTSLDAAICRFRSSDITGVIELDALIECNRLCHRMLAEHLDIDPFESLFQEANRSVQSHLGCISQHVFWEVTYDLSHNYCYNDSTNRFVLTAVPFGEKLLRDDAPVVGAEYLWGSKGLNSCYEAVFRLYRGFVGNEHFRVVCRLLGYQGIYVVVAELMKICESMIKTNLRQIFRRLLQVMPRELKPPKQGQTSDQVFADYYRQLGGVYQMSALSTDMCQAFREFGNIVVFVLMLEQNLTVQESCDLRHAAPFTGVLPRPFIPPPTDATRTLDRRDTHPKDLQAKKLEHKFAVLHVAKIVAKFGTPEQAQLARENEVLTKERLCCGLVMFEQVLRGLQQFLLAPEGNGQEPSQGEYVGGSLWQGLRPLNEVMEVHECTEFHRVWSAIQFVFCTPRGENEFNIEELFGEGLSWAGCTIIALLGQQRRFEALDIGGQLMRVQRADQRTETAENVSLERLASRIRRFSVLHGQIFATLNRFLCPVDRHQAMAASVRHFPTPVFQAP